jgi:hypothetical protein
MYRNASPASLFGDSPLPDIFDISPQTHLLSKPAPTARKSLHENLQKLPNDDCCSSFPSPSHLPPSSPPSSPVPLFSPGFTSFEFSKDGSIFDKIPDLGNDVTVTNVEDPREVRSPDDSQLTLKPDVVSLGIKPTPPTMDAPLVDLKQTGPLLSGVDTSPNRLSSR